MTLRFSCPRCGQRLIAPQEAAGQRIRCPGCQGILHVARDGSHATPEVAEQEILEPEVVDDDQDFDPYEVADEPLEQAAASTPSATPPTEENRRPCPTCGEIIAIAAMKCRFCGEIFDSRLKTQQRSKDESMTAWDWVLAILCSGIGCILGIVWMIQGKKKGAKMAGISILFAVLWNIVRGLAELGNL